MSNSIMRGSAIRDRSRIVPRGGEQGAELIVTSALGWMAAGLGTTCAIALAVESSPGLLASVLGGPVVWFLLLAELGLVFWLSGWISEMDTGTASAVFLLYSGLNGVTLAPIFYVYTGESLVNAFLVTAILFATMAFYGHITKRDLSSLGGFLFMGLVGIIIASLVNMFIQRELLDFVISCVGVLIFTGLTAYDAQRIQALADRAEGSEGRKRVSILGALMLYLDFLNLFLMLLRFMGRQRER